MNEDRIRKAHAALERAAEEHEQTMRAIHEEMRAKMEAATAKMQAAVAVFEQEVGAPRRPRGPWRNFDFRRYGPPRPPLPRGGSGLEPAPVVPRPKPMPLQGGAEAPLD